MNEHMRFICSEVIADLSHYADTEWRYHPYFSAQHFKRNFRKYRFSIWCNTTYPVRNGIPRLQLNATSNLIQYAKGINLLQQLQIGRSSKYVTILCRVLLSTEDRVIPRERANKIVEYAAKRISNFNHSRYVEIYQNALHDSELYVILFNMGLAFDLQKPSTLLQFEHLKDLENSLRKGNYEKRL